MSPQPQRQPDAPEPSGTTPSRTPMDAPADWRTLDGIVLCPQHGKALRYVTAANPTSPEFRCENGHSLVVEDGILDLVPPPTDESDDEESIRTQVERWYDEFGWTRTADGKLQDTVLFGETQPQGYGLYEMRSHLSFVQQLGGGGLLLDAGCGGFAHPEYAAYSWFHRQRVCVDISVRALLEARSRLGPGALFVRADLCRLPFRDNGFGGIVSGYVVQHIDQELQETALQELYRVLAPRAQLCIMTGVRKSTAYRLVAAVVMVLAWLGRLGRRPVIHRDKDASASAAGANLYYAPQTSSWWVRQAHSVNGHVRLFCLRIFKRKDYEALFGTEGRHVNWLRRLEELMPSLLARASRYVLVVIRKNG